MKKQRTYTKKSFTPVTLFKEDLIEIEALLKPAQGKVRVEADGYVYDSVEELIQHRPATSIRNLTIETDGYGCEVSFGRWWSHVRYGTDTAHHVGVGAMVEKRVSQCCRWPKFCYNMWFLNFLIIFSSYELLGTTTLLKNLIGSSIISSALPVAGVLWWLWGGFVTFSQYSLMSTRSRAVSSFWTRNKDALTVALIAAAVGLLLSPVFSKYITPALPETGKAQTLAPKKN